MKRHSQCQKCENSESYRKGWNDAGEPVWICTLCGEETPRQIRKSAKRKQIDAWFNEIGI